MSVDDADLEQLGQIGPNRGCGPRGQVWMMAIKSAALTRIFHDATSSRRVKPPGKFHPRDVISARVKRQRSFFVDDQFVNEEIKVMAAQELPSLGPHYLHAEAECFGFQKDSLT